MGYHLGIDLGTTYTAAAVERGGRVEAVTLGNRTVSVPSVVFLKPDDTILVGDAANRRGVTEPERLAREFKRRVGDPTPILVGGTPYGAEVLTARLLRWVVERVAELQGGPADAIALTHPANWGPYKLDLLTQAARHADLHVARWLTEPEAAATYYASQERIEAGSIVAVYDLGGGTFDVSILRKRDDGFDILGTPEGVERLGGIDFDQAVFAHVISALGGAVESLDPDDPAVVAAVARLRRECTEAKEALSSDTDAAIPVVLPTLQTEVRLTRGEFENMIRPALNETIVAMQRALRAAQVTPEQVSAVLLVGGSSRIPLVAQLVAGEIGRPIAVDANPKDAICLGAAIAAAQAVGAASPESVTPVVSEAAFAAPVAAAPGWTQPAQEPAAYAQPATEPAYAPQVAYAPEPAKKSPAAIIAVVVAVVLLAAGAAFALSGGDGGGENAGGTTTTQQGEATTLATDAPTSAPQEYTEALRSSFINSCVAGSSGGTGSAQQVQDFCECAMTEIEENIPFARFVEADAEINESGEFPADLLAAIEPCNDTSN